NGYGRTIVSCSKNCGRAAGGACNGKCRRIQESERCRKTRCWNDRRNNYDSLLGKPSPRRGTCSQDFDRVPVTRTKRQACPIQSTRSPRGKPPRPACSRCGKTWNPHWSVVIRREFACMGGHSYRSNMVLCPRSCRSGTARRAEEHDVVAEFDSSADHLFSDSTLSGHRHIPPTKGAGSGSLTHYPAICGRCSRRPDCSRWGNRGLRPL